MVVHYPRTVGKNCYAEHEVTGKTYKQKQIFIGKTGVSMVYIYGDWIGNQS